MNYAKELPKSKNETNYDNGTPAFVSLQSQVGNPGASSVISLNVNTTVVQISTVTGIPAGQGIIGKWGAGSVTTANFDLYVAGGMSQMFVVPVSVAGVRSNLGANVDNGLYASLAVKPIGANASASIITVEW